MRALKVVLRRRSGAMLAPTPGRWGEEHGLDADTVTSYRRARERQGTDHQDPAAPKCFIAGTAIVLHPLLIVEAMGSCNVEAYAMVGMTCLPGIYVGLHAALRRV